MGGGGSGNQALAAQAMPAGGIRPEERFERSVSELVVSDEMLEQKQGREGVVEGVVPTAAGVMRFEDRGKAAVFAEK